ncbi:MAG: GGDEF domain-containing protein [Paracoccus sp. (in: a-proteobacteria)]|nr:GGDEF domain-containing protein [Paracoccus sp. (in: a-proteobacteria)]
MTCPQMEAILRTDALNRLLPMHLLLSAEGRVISVGATLRKALPGIDRGIRDQLSDARAFGDSDVLCRIHAASRDGSRLFLRATDIPDLILRGHAVQGVDGQVLLNLGFGIGIGQAITRLGLTDADFSPTDLVLEFLFLLEANRAVLAELARFNAQLSQARRLALTQAHSDSLTGLTNRRGAEAILAGMLWKGVDDRRAQEPFALVHLDLDHFKAVNDRLGHKAGDDLLRRVAEALKQTLRKADTAARIGGDEFLLILRGMTCALQLEQLCQRLIVAIERTSPAELPEIRISASLGVVVWTPLCGLDAEGLLLLSDKALYQSKHRGRGVVTILKTDTDGRE